MGRQTRSKKAEEPLGKGKVTPVQVAFIVDRYLCDNNLSETRSVFRNEASSLVSRSPAQEAPKNLLSLGAILNEYICLKEQKVMMDQERVRLEHEKFRIQSLLQGMQDVMNGYNMSGSAAPLIQASQTRPLALVPQPNAPPSTGSPAAYVVYKSPTPMPISTPSNTTVKYVPSPTTNTPVTRKRTGSNVAEVPLADKKSRINLPSRKTPNEGTCEQSDIIAITQATIHPSSQKGSSQHKATSTPLQGSSVAKSLFNQPTQSSPSNSSGPNTPQQVAPLQAGKLASPLGASSNSFCRKNNTPQEATSTNCTVITSERVTVSPCKHVSYTLERNRCFSSSPSKTPLKRLGKRDHVKGRLDFDGSNTTANMDIPNSDGIATSGSENEGDIFDMDLPNLDSFGPNFFSELFVDLDLDSEEIACPSQPTLGASIDALSGSSPESMDGNKSSDQVLSEFSSGTEVISEKDMHIQGSDTLTAVRSITKCIKILSPAKHHRSSLHEEDCLVTN